MVGELSITLLTVASLVSDDGRVYALIKNYCFYRSGCMQTLVKWGAEIDSLTSVSGDSALHLAASSGHLHLVKYIISAADDWVSVLAAINNDAETALERATVMGQESVVEYLSNLKVGASTLVTLVLTASFGN